MITPSAVGMELVEEQLVCPWHPNESMEQMLEKVISFSKEQGVLKKKKVGANHCQSYSQVLDQIFKSLHVLTP